MGLVFKAWGLEVEIRVYGLGWLRASNLESCDTKRVSSTVYSGSPDAQWLWIRRGGLSKLWILCVPILWYGPKNQGTTKTDHNFDNPP